MKIDCAEQLQRFAMSEFLGSIRDRTTAKGPDWEPYALYRFLRMVFAKHTSSNC